MEKKELYETPSAEVWKMTLESGILTVSGPNSVSNIVNGGDLDDYLDE